MNMDDIKIFPKNQNARETSIEAIRIYSQDIGMKFCGEKCTILTIKTKITQETELFQVTNGPEDLASIPGQVIPKT